MKRSKLGLMLLVAFSGCTPNDRIISENGAPQATVDAHSHPHEGPHHGTLVELGNEEYHAEVTHEQDLVTVYILDTKATNPVPIDSTEVTINVMHDGKPEQFKLEAAPDRNDAPGKSSRFSLTNADLAAQMDQHAVTPKLNVTIEGKAYRGEIHHDHAGHALK